MISSIYLVWLLVVPFGSEEMVTLRATCESTGLGEPARITCHYRGNVVEARDVTAVSLLHATDGKLEAVVECHRFLNNGFDCLPKVGYKLNGTILDKMIINIPRALPEHHGTYYCEIGIQKTEYQMESCDMQYKEPHNTTTSTPPPDRDTDDQLKGDTGTSDAILTVIAVSVLFLVLMVISVLVFLLVRRRHRHRCSRASRATSKYERGYELCLHRDTGNSGRRYKHDRQITEVKLTSDVLISKHVGASSDNSKQKFAICKSCVMAAKQNTSGENSIEGTHHYCEEHHAHLGDQNTHGVTVSGDSDSCENRNENGFTAGMLRSPKYNIKMRPPPRSHRPRRIVKHYLST